MTEKSIKLVVPNKNELNSMGVLQSTHQIQEIDIIIKEINNKQQSYKSNFINRQITSGLIIDWNNYQNKNAKGQLIVKDGNHSENIIFSYLIQSEHSNGQPKKVIYKWIKRFPKKYSEVFLQEQEHIYRGAMKNKKKHGQAQYIIIRRFSDNKKHQQLIKGIWNQDILISGKIVDNNGNLKMIADSSITLCSKRQIGFIQQNKTIRFQTRRLSTQLMGKNRISGEMRTQAAQRFLKSIDKNNGYNQ